MRSFKFIFFTVISFIGFIFSGESADVFAQTTYTRPSSIQQKQQKTPDSAVVIVESDFLRTQPSYTSPTVAVVIKGAKIKVSPSTFIKGWYIAVLEEAPSISGYIHGNSIKLLKSASTIVAKKNVVPKQNTMIIPKNILLNTNPKLDGAKINKTKRMTTGQNYCKTSFFCPDIEDVQVALFDNKDKFQKDKFEKTTDWEKRKSGILRNIKLSETHTAADKIYLLYDSGTGSVTYDGADYDADKELWSFEFNFIETSYTTNIPILSQSSGQIIYLIVPKKLGKKVKSFVSMPPTVAAANDKKLQIAFAGRIVEPYLWSNDFSSSNAVISGIHFELEEIICLNPNTGQKWKVEIPNNPLAITPTPNNNNFDSSSNDELANYKRELITDPMNAKAYLEVGKIYSKQGNFENAISNLRTALYWDFNLIDGHIELAKIYFIRGDCQQFRNYLESATKIDSKNKSVLSLKRISQECSLQKSKPKES